jgi:hypothetical protein
MIFKNYKFWIVFSMLLIGMVAVVQGCGNASPISSANIQAGTP